MCASEFLLCQEGTQWYFCTNAPGGFFFAKVNRWIIVHQCMTLHQSIIVHQCMIVHQRSTFAPVGAAWCTFVQRGWKVPLPAKLRCFVAFCTFVWPAFLVMSPYMHNAWCLKLQKRNWLLIHPSSSTNFKFGWLLLPWANSFGIHCS